ncbi:MAG: type IV secretion system protein, partial [Alphaproteobacteria bacterium]
LDGSKKFIKFNNYSVSNVSSFANTDYYPSNSRLITLFTNSKLAVTSKTNCGDIFFKKFNFIEIRIMQTGFVNIKNITGQSCNLKARIINPSGEKCIKADLTPCATEYLYDNSISPATEQISHFFEYDSNFNSSSIDPINDLSVNSNFSTNNIFVRKGQRIRILPETHQQDISFTHAGSSIAKKCGFGMFFKINPRPALMCFSAQSAETTKTPNPSCKENYGKYIPTFKMSITGSDPLNPDSIDSTATEVTMPPEGQIECSSTIDCTSEAELANSRTNLNTGKYCTSHEKCAPVDCSYNADGVPSCSDGTIDTQICNASYVSKNNPSCCNSQAGPDSCGDPNNPNDISISKTCNPHQCCNNKNCNTEKLNSTCNIGSQQMCNNCQAARKDNLNLINKYINVNNFNCYDFENSDGFSSYRLIQNKSSANKFDDDFKKKYNIEDLTTIETKDSLDYGNLLSYENFTSSSGSGFKKIENLIPFTNQEVTFFKINNQNFKDFTTHSPDTPTYTFYLPDIITYSNGEKLEAVLCKESSSTSIDCMNMSTSGYDHSSNITVLSSEDYKLGLSAKKNFIKINPDGKMERIMDFREDGNADITNFGNALKCNQPPKYYNNKNWFCFKNDLGNPQEINKYKLTFRIKDVNSVVTDNNGEYEIEIFSNKFDNDASTGIVKKILDLITSQFFEKADDPTTSDNEYKPGILKDFYTQLTSHLLFKTVVNIAIVMSITFFGMGFLMGVSEIKHSEIMKILLKIGFIYLFVSPTIGWVWYNKFFVQLFTSATDYLTFSVALIFGNAESISNKILTNDFSDKSILFASTDRILTILFSDAVIAKVGALIFSSIFGWLYFVLIVYTFINYIYAIANTILLFITCQITTIVLLIIGPFFFIFLLFKITKDMFDNWVKALIGFSLQQIFLVLVISFFNGIIEIFLKNALGYRVCWTEVLKLNIILTTVALFNFWTVAGTNSTSVYSESTPEESFGNTQNMPPLISFISLYIIVGIMKKFVDFFSNLAYSLAGGLKATSIGAEAKALGNQAMGMAKSVVSKIYASTAGQMVDRADKFLFDSGKIADAERKQQMDVIKGMIKDKAMLKTVGKDAVEDYKKNNALKLAGMSQADQKKELENVRNNAIKNYAEYNGIKNVDEIMNMKGLNYNGTNLIMGAAQGAKQALFTDGALFNSARDKENQGKNLANISFSKDDAMQAMKSMDKKDKETFLKAVEDGTIHVNKGRIEQARSAIVTVAKLPEASIKAISNPKNSAKAVGSGIVSGAKYIAKSAKEAVGGSDLKKEAIAQLKSEGKIDKFKENTPSFVENAIRSKEDNKLINERMQRIASETRTFDEKPKITSDQVIKNLKSFSELVEAQRNSESGSDLKASLKNKFEIAKNFITFNNTEGKTKNQKKLDQMIKNQANKNALNSISGNNQDEKTNK